MAVMVCQNVRRLLGLKRKRDSACRSEGVSVEEDKKTIEGKQATRAFKPEQLDGRIISSGERKRHQQMTPPFGLCIKLNHGTHEKNQLWRRGQLSATNMSFS